MRLHRQNIQKGETELLNTNIVVALLFLNSVAVLLCAIWLRRISKDVAELFNFVMELYEDERKKL
jgi:hypothetical protein